MSTGRSWKGGDVPTGVEFEMEGTLVILGRSQSIVDYYGELFNLW